MNNWNPSKFFFLTRNPIVEITTVGGNYGDVDIYHEGSLFWFGNQRIMGTPTPDRWGRGHIDQTFVALCIKIYYFMDVFKPQKVFKSLTTRKEGDKYLVRVQYDNEDLEMEVEEMFHYFSKKLKESHAN